MSKIKIEDLKVEAKEHNWELISESYQNLDSDLEYKCDKGHRLTIPYKKVRKGYNCPVCKEFNGSTKMDIFDSPIEKPKEKYCILAFDQSSKINGFSVFYNDELVNYGLIEIKGKTPPIRFLGVRKWIDSLVKQWTPDKVIIEDIQLQNEEQDGAKGAVTFKILAELIGVLETYFVENKINYELANISTWRNCEQIGGKDRKEKKAQAQARVKKCYNIDVTDDVADAILIGRYAVEGKKKEKIIYW